MNKGIKSKEYKWWILPSIILFVVVSSLLISYSQPFRELEMNVNDQLFKIRGPIPIQDTTVVLVTISQQAEEEIPYKYPWPTRYYAKLIEHLNEAGAKAIGIDVIFDKRDQYNPENDSIFASVLRKYDNVVLAGDYEVVSQQRGEGAQSISISMVQPLELLQDANSNPFGLVRMVKDKDDAIRRYLFSLEFLGETYYTLGLEVLKVYHGWEDSVVEDSEDYFRFGDYNIPKYGPNSMYINYFGSPGSFPDYSFDTVIDDSSIMLNSEDEDFQFNAFSNPEYGLKVNEVFKDKIVLVGAKIPALHDFHATPFAEAGNRPGVEIHSNAIQTILTGKYVRTPPQWANLLLLLCFTIVIVVTTHSFDALKGFFFFIFQTIFITVLIVFEFLNFHIILDYTGPIIASGIGYVSTLGFRYLKEEREKQRIRDMFSSYVAPAFVDEIVESGQEPQLGGEEVYLTAFFSDIQSFSTFSEVMEPNQLVELINEYLSAMTSIITEEGGTLDKYIGDAIVAFFGAPLPQEDHAYRACIVSQLMQQKLLDLREKWGSESEKWPDIAQHMQTRIGINTGNMIIGNMGSNRRFNYTIMGDNVNLAARCETGSRSYGVYSMVTGETKNEAEKFGNRCVFRFLDKIVVRGRSRPVDVFEIMGLRDQMYEDQFTCIDLFENGIDAYLEQDWQRAIGYFEQSARYEPRKPADNPFITTNPSLVYLDRCREMSLNPPDEEWNGVYVMRSK